MILLEKNLIPLQIIYFAYPILKMLLFLVKQDLEKATY